MTTRGGTEYQTKKNKKYFSSLKELYESRKKYFQEPATFTAERYVGQGSAGLIDTSVRIPINYTDNERDKILTSTFSRILRMYDLGTSIQVGIGERNCCSYCNIFSL